MGLEHGFKTAIKRIGALDEDERQRILTVCREISRAQRALTHKAGPLLANCMDRCQGLCCRNIQVSDIVTHWDLVYILLMAPQIEEGLAACIARETFFASDCVFLMNGRGPCLFPDNVRPERCIISFCRVEPCVEKEIGRVMGGFSRLIRFFMLRPFHRLARRVMPTWRSED